MTLSATARPRVVIAGGSGFLGTALTPALVRDGYDVTILSRAGADGGPAIAGVKRVAWDARSPGAWVSELDGAFAVINLVGRSVDCRKTERNRRIILESRVNSVAALTAACGQVAAPPKVWVQSATAHIYGDTGDEILDDSSPLGTGFAPDVGRAWEAALDAAPLPGTRKVVLRISFVLGRAGGALRTLRRLTQCFLGGTVGSGRQYISWIHVDDLNAIILRALGDERMSGVYVVTSPDPVTNRDFMRELRRVLHRPWSPPAPAPLVRLGSILLRTDPELALLGRRIVPTRLLAEGITFRFASLSAALDDLLQSRSKPPVAL